MYKTILAANPHIEKNTPCERNHKLTCIAHKENQDYVHKVVRIFSHSSFSLRANCVEIVCNRLPSHNNR